MSKLYTTGVFFFILMYTGPNIGKFLSMTHTTVLQVENQILESATDHHDIFLVLKGWKM